MADTFEESTDWQGAGWAFAVWAAHFSALWGASSIFPADPAARWIALGATVLALAALALLWRARVAGRRGEGGLVMPLALGLSGLAIAFGGLPAMIG